MDKIIKPWRLFVILFLIVAMTAVFVVTLYRLQIVEGASYYAQSQNFVSTTVTVPAARGEILDRYGRVLVSNKVVNDITIDTTSLFEQEDPNAVILELARAVTDSGAEYTDTLPITKEAPFAYVDNMTDTQRTRLAAYLKMNKLSDATTAVELMAYFRKAFKIDDNYSSEDMRTIAGIRYEIKTRYIANVDYVFAENVSIDLITKLMERNVPGFNVVNSYKREYNTKYAAHLLGSVGLMDPDEYETFKEQGYLMNAVVGKSGAEKAFEQYLHSTDGQAVITKTRGGTVVNTRYTKNPEPGNNISLTIDLGLQETAENALASFIESNNAVRESENAALRAMGATKDVKDLISGGAIVAVNVKTGEPLCLASYPTYDLRS
jgi:penicillin-binding protein 2